MKTHYSLGMAAMGMGVLAAGLGAAASANEAVSGFNGKVSGLYGSVDGEDAAAAEASVSIPLGSRFGFQADGLLGKIDPEDIHGLGGHLFWRDSTFALLGMSLTWAEYGEIEVGRAGLESEYYLNHWTFAAALGHQTGDIDDALYGGVEVRLYPAGDLLLSAAWSRADSEDRYGAGAEWQTPFSGLSVFAQVAGGDDDYEHVLGGLRFYLGEAKTLARRHREDDPASMLLQSLTSNLRAAQAAARARESVAPGAANGQEPAIPGGNVPEGSGPEENGPEEDSPEAGGPDGGLPEVNPPEVIPPEPPEVIPPKINPPVPVDPEDDDSEDDEESEGRRDRKKDSPR